ncbi:MAG: pyridoxal-phosphate dependent enzyme [Pseudomonadota bacterium]
MSAVSLLRLDQMGGAAPGNKSFKLIANWQQAEALGLERLVSFGGSWSNHLHALAALGAEQGFATVGIVRDAHSDTEMLKDVRRFGMEVVKVSRGEYRRRYEPAYIDDIARRFEPCMMVPEGGANAAGVAGCAAVADLIKQYAPGIDHIALSVGTGTTLAGLVAGLGKEYHVTGVSALKGALDLESKIAALLQKVSTRKRARWQILHDGHCGGFAKVSADLKRFILAFEDVQGVPLEPVYTGKLMYAIHQQLAAGAWPIVEPVLAVHTGGLQGRRGYPWLNSSLTHACHDTLRQHPNYGCDD